MNQKGGIEIMEKYQKCNKTCKYFGEIRQKDKITVSYLCNLFVIPIDYHDVNKMCKYIDETIKEANQNE